MGRPLILSFEVVVFLLALYKGVEEWKNGILRHSPLLQIMVRDSLAYFFMYAPGHDTYVSPSLIWSSVYSVFALDIVNFVLWLYSRVIIFLSRCIVGAYRSLCICHQPTAANVMFTFTTTMMPVLGTQMLINIRTEGAIPFDSLGGMQTSDGATVEFRRTTLTTETHITREGTHTLRSAASTI